MTKNEKIQEINELIDSVVKLLGTHAYSDEEMEEEYDNDPNKCDDTFAFDHWFSINELKKIAHIKIMAF